MTSGFFILKGHEVVPADKLAWDKFMEANSDNRTVAIENISEFVFVSTVFVGISWGGPPLLFETMIFGGQHDGWTERCQTWADAEEAHKRAIEVATSTNQ